MGREGYRGWGGVYFVLQGVQRNMTVERRFEGRVRSLKWFAAFICERALLEVKFSKLKSERNS